MEAVKRVMSEKGHSQAKKRSFTEEIKKVVSFYRVLLDDRKLLEKLCQEHGMRPDERKYSGLRVHMRVARVLKCLGKWVNTNRQIGDISGIKVGDEFLWRGELCIVGLHHEFQRGIDCMKLFNGKIVAISIVDSGRYENVAGITSGQLVYCGEGENLNLGRGKKPKDQKLVGGNLALKNSMDYKMPIRVIRRFNNIDSGSSYKFVYDGLYRVTKFWKESGKFGTYVYKFSLIKY
ncbi:hypothetical protein REPUB_Repub04eG0025100 [Reevesia pubescens]